MTVPQLIYRAAGSPPVDAFLAGMCRLCGAEDRGQPFDGWLKDTFTDHDLLRPGDIVCRGCLLLTQNFSRWYQDFLSRDKPQKPWNWSHFVLRGEYIVLSKGEKDRITEILLSDPEVAVIAVSGQKHLAFRARPRVWQFELVPIRSDPARLAEQLGLVTALYSGGATKAEIASGRYNAGSIRRIGLERWRELEEAVRPHRGSPMLELAIFLAQKGADDNHDRIPTGEPERDSRGQYALL